jgi:hypothetical protein
LSSVSDPRHVSVGPNQHRLGSIDGTDDREVPRPGVSSVDLLHPVRPWRDVKSAEPTDVKSAGLTEVEKYRSSLVQQ